MAVFHHDDNGEVLKNPGMGWVIHSDIRRDHRDPNEPDTYENLHHVALLSRWADLEPEEGRFFWDDLDAAIEKWTALGMGLQLRISTDAMIYNHSADGAPAWLYENYAIPYQEREGYGLTMRYPDYLNPIYQQKLRAFLHALATHMAPVSNLETVDLRGYGEWGEWHSGYIHESEALHAQALRQIIDIWQEAFSYTTLTLSCSYEWRHDLTPPLHSPRSQDEYLYFSGFDHALSHENISFRRDGIGGAVKIWDTRLMNDYYQQRRRRPMICEYFGGYRGKLSEDGMRGYHVEDSVEEALMLHPNYMMLMWDSVEFCEKRPDLIAWGLKRMGYRLLPCCLSLPDAAKPGECITLSHTWQNLGCGRLCEDAILTITLKCEEKEISYPIRGNDFGWLSENESRTWYTPLVIPRDFSGECRIFFSLATIGGEVISLPVANGPLAKIQVTE